MQPIQKLSYIFYWSYMLENEKSIFENNLLVNGQQCAPMSFVQCLAKYTLIRKLTHI